MARKIKTVRDVLLREKTTSLKDEIARRLVLADIEEDAGKPLQAEHIRLVAEILMVRGKAGGRDRIAEIEARQKEMMPGMLREMYPHMQ